MLLLFKSAASQQYTLPADTGSFAEDGIAASLKLAHLVAALPGSDSLTGTGAALEYGRALTAEPGGIALIGSDAYMGADHLLSGVSGVIQIDIAAADLLAGRLLEALAGELEADAYENHYLGVTRQVVQETGGSISSRRRQRTVRRRRYSDPENFNPTVPEIITAVAAEQVARPRPEPERVEQLTQALRSQNVEISPKHTEALDAELERLIGLEVQKYLKDLMDKEDESLVAILAVLH